MTQKDEKWLDKITNLIKSNKTLEECSDKIISDTIQSGVTITANGYIDKVYLDHAMSISAIATLPMASGGVGYGGGPGYGVSPGYTTTYTMPSVYSSISAGTTYWPFTTIISLMDGQGKQIVKLNEDGTVTWAAGIQIDEAADAFGKSFNLGAERKVGITNRVKSQMRDSVFNDLIDIAKIKGSLSAEDLQYLLSASKIVEKLKGGE
jgi:hypothetical protein